MRQVQNVFHEHQARQSDQVERIDNLGFGIGGQTSDVDDLLLGIGFGAFTTQLGGQDGRGGGFFIALIASSIPPNFSIESQMIPLISFSFKSSEVN